jgi:hypothetical protein
MKKNMSTVSTLLATVVRPASKFITMSSMPEQLDSTQTYWSQLSQGGLTEYVDQTVFRSLGKKTAWNPAGAIRDRWNTELLPILKNILDDPGNYEKVFENKSKHPRATYHLYMVGEQMRWQQAQPTIVVICVKNRIAKRIIHLLKSIESFKALKLGFDFLAYKAKISFHAGDAKHESLSEQPRTLCGSKVVMSPFPLPRSPPWSQATIGGLILLDGTFYGLTVAHAFYPDDSTDDETDTCSISSGTEEISELDDDEIWSRGGSQTNQRAVESPEASEAYTVYLGKPVTAPTTLPDSLDSLSFVGTLTPARSSLLAAIDMTGPIELKWLSREKDWALVRIEAPQFQAPNEIKIPDGRNLRLEIPYLGHTPPEDNILAIAGVSGIYESKCSDTMCGIMLPGSKAVQYAWTMDSHSRTHPSWFRPFIRIILKLLSQAPGIVEHGLLTLLTENYVVQLLLSAKNSRLPMFCR